MSRIAPAALLLSLATLAGAQDAPELPPLIGKVDGTTYVSPTGAFKVQIPVLPELGGSITDTANVVTFQDSFTTHISIAAFPQDATQRWQLSTLGTRDYLKYFFENFVIADFSRAYQDLQVETNARFLPSTFDGAFIAYVLIPGGSMFANRVEIVANEAKPRVAKRGNMLFVKNGFIFVLSTELAERVTEGAAYHQSTDAEDNLLRERLIEISRKIKFLAPPAAKAGG